MSKWKDISTAPKDNASILVYVDVSDSTSYENQILASYEVVSFQRLGATWGTSYGRRFTADQVKGWMLLPEAPAYSIEDDEDKEEMSDFEYKSGCFITELEGNIAEFVNLIDTKGDMAEQTVRLLAATSNKLQDLFDELDEIKEAEEKAIIRARGLIPNRLTDESLRKITEDLRNG